MEEIEKIEANGKHRRAEERKYQEFMRRENIRQIKRMKRDEEDALIN